MYKLYPPSDDLIEVVEIILNENQASTLDVFTRHLTDAGGPSVSGVQKIAKHYAELFFSKLSVKQKTYLDNYADGHMAVLMFTGMLVPDDFDIPDVLPSLAELEYDSRGNYLAARNQLLLCLVQQRPFAFDMDNDGKIVRFVANFKGGGRIPRDDEGPAHPVNLSSHAGAGLGPHTEAPYHCSVHSRDLHSPAPSSLILTALWNPLDEPTQVIPLGRILDEIGIRDALALTSPSFRYTRSDSFVKGKGEQDSSVSILEFDPQGEFSVRYNNYRFSVLPDATPLVKQAFMNFKSRIQSATPFAFSLQPSSALIINNSRALHCREIIQDNRRLLIRLFGYSRFAEPIILSDDPLIVQG